jgi:hypothetical protein
MARKSPGLQKRCRLWWIDKRIKGFGRLCESCGTDSLPEEERYLTRRLDEIRNALVYGIRPTRTFAEAQVSAYFDALLCAGCLQADRSSRQGL